MPQSSEFTRRTFLKYFWLAVLFHLLAAWFSEGYHHYDEHFQVLEFINYKLGFSPASALPWEFGQKIRPWLQPFVGWLTVLAVRLVGIDNPFVWAGLLRLISAALGLVATLLFIHSRRFVREDARAFGTLSFFLFLTWFFPYLHARFSSEGWSTSLLLLSFSLLSICVEKGSIRPGHFLLAGFLAGLAVQCRYSSIVMVVPGLLWFVLFRRGRVRTGTVLLGILLAFGLGAIVDYWGYGSWNFTFLRYFRANLVENKLSSFGVTPWWMYFRYLTFDGTFLFAWPLMLGTLVGAAIFWRDLATWLTLPFVVFHFFLGHKETRFLFPVLPFAVLLTIKVADRILPPRFFKNGVRFFIVVNFLYLAVATLKPATVEVSLLRYLYSAGGDALTYYVIDDNPYEAYGLRTRFYEPPLLREITVRRPADLAPRVPPGTEALIVSHHFALPREITDAMRECRVVYRTLPNFVNSLNFGHWIERTSLWSAFRCRARRK